MVLVIILGLAVNSPDFILTTTVTAWLERERFRVRKAEKLKRKQCLIFHRKVALAEHKREREYVGACAPSPSPSPFAN